MPLIESQLSFPLFWLAFGVVLCLVELFLPKILVANYRLVPLLSGFCSLILAFFLFRASRVPEFKYQVLYWMGLSLGLVIWIRPMIRKGKRYVVREAIQAKTVTEILPGETGRVLYEGCLWQACCEDQTCAIAPNQKVFVLRREGNILIVMPEKMFDS